MILFKDVSIEDVDSPCAQYRYILKIQLIQTCPLVGKQLHSVIELFSFHSNRVLCLLRQNGTPYFVQNSKQQEKITIISKLSLIPSDLSVTTMDIIIFSNIKRKSITTYKYAKLQDQQFQPARADNTLCNL